MNFILKDSKQMPFYTDLKLIFDALKGRQNEFNWLITDIDHVVGGVRGTYKGEKPIAPPVKINVHNHEIEIFKKDIVWMSGEELTEIVNSNRIQFIWGVFLGFSKEIQLDLDKLEVVPYAENPGFWINEPKIQHPLATIEIVCWDSSLSLFLSKDDDLSERFKAYFTDAVDLDDYNSVRGK